jgi:transcriptional regulator
MSRKIQAKLILQLRAAGLTQNMIAKSHHMSKTSVGEVFRIAEEKGVSYSYVESKGRRQYTGYCFRKSAK